MGNRILFIEDNPHKRSRIVEYLESLGRDIKITEGKSFTSGSQALLENEFKLILLDISLPTYDRIGAESGGRFRSFAGREIARKLIRSGKSTPILFITQYTAFSERGASYTFDILKEELRKECGENFAGMAFYDSSQLGWKEEISNVISRIFG